MTQTFIVDRKNLAATHWRRTPSVALESEEVRTAVDSFALTANNITYAAFGEAMHYWAFFPTGDDATGCIPVWGFADVTESRCDGVAVGERFYGYWPIASELVLQPVRVRPAGFVDGRVHRQALPGLYNQYLRCSTDPGHVAAFEAQQALLRPLFGTAFVLDDFLADNAFFGARSVLLSSASSKTAYSTAFCLARRREAAGQHEGVKIVGLTSPANLAFARSLSCYDSVLAYDAVEQLSADEPVVYVDFSGSVNVRGRVHRHFAERLAYSCAVGGTHWSDLGGRRGLPGPRPTLFFAPAQVTKRVADWGAEVFRQRSAAAWAAFMLPVTRAEQPWLRVVRGRGAAAIDATYAALLAGRLEPAEGHLLSP